MKFKMQDINLRNEYCKDTVMIYKKYIYIKEINHDLEVEIKFIKSIDFEL